MLFPRSDESRWSCYVGILVDSTTYKNQRWFHIFCPELLPYKTEDVTIENTEHSINIENILTNTTESKTIKGTTTIYADYFGLDFSRDVPTMYRGMQVLVVNYGNSDKYYWLPMERDDYLRPFEHNRISCLDIAQTNKKQIDGDNIEEKDATITDDNSYYFEIDTKYNKQILMSTANSDGEAWRYFFKINANEHVVELWDQCSDGSQLNNLIKLESRPGMDSKNKGRITLQTAGGTEVVLNSEDLHIKVPRNMTLSVGGDLAVQVKGSVAKAVGKDYDETIKGTRRLALDGSLIEVIEKDHKQIIHQNKTVEVTYKYSDTSQTKIVTNEIAMWRSNTFTVETKELISIKSPTTILDFGVTTLKFTTNKIVGTSAVVTFGELAFTFNKGFILTPQGTITP